LALPDAPTLRRKEQALALLYAVMSPDWSAA